MGSVPCSRTCPRGSGLSNFSKQSFPLYSRPNLAKKKFKLNLKIILIIFDYLLRFFIAELLFGLLLFL